MKLTDTEPILDVAVVGAGVAGLYTAWRLASAEKGPGRRLQSMCVFESAGKEGGRLVSEIMPGMPFRAELGGMRFTERQVLFTALLKNLKEESKPFEFPTELYFLRGQHLAPQAKPPYEVLKGEAGKSSIDLVRYALAKAIRDFRLPSDCPERRTLRSIIKKLNPNSLNNSTFSARQWEILKRYARLQDQALYAIGLWNLLRFYLSNEAFQYARDSFGYQSILANWNAAEAIPWFLRDFGVDYRTVTRGMDRIPTKLAYELSKLHPNSLHTGRTVTAVEYVTSPERHFILSFRETTEKARARVLVIAVPEKSLGSIDLIGIPKSEIERFQDALDSVARHRLFKLFLGYRRAWWNFPGKKSWSSGRAVTDLPIRQVYYFGPDKALDTTTHRAMLMASYSDAYFVDFWTPLHRSPLPEAHEDSYCEGNLRRGLGASELVLLKGLGASERMVRKAHRLVCELHPNIKEIPKPLVALEREWPSGWHTWKVHYKSWEIMRQLKKPFNVPIYICGEAYSPEQGWVEGALRSAEMVLRDLRLPPPAWMSDVDWSADGFENFEEYIGIWQGVDPKPTEPRAAKGRSEGGSSQRGTLRAKRS